MFNIRYSIAICDLAFSNFSSYLFTVEYVYVVLMLPLITT